MRYCADLHIHSRYSRATSKDLSIVGLGRAALGKGIDVLGTGDFTHPAWIEELEEHLVPAEEGLFKLREGPHAVRFVLSSEISTIYKQDGRVRKVHHLLLAPDFAAVRAISTRLASIGNILSDGRPILGLSSRNLLEIVLEGSGQACLIPAHIWTPWFSALGSKSGFDTIAECYGDLASHIFAVETGLSSDPPMNWRVRSLDNYHLISNSDAHSADKLGREATLFDTARDYPSLIEALRTGQGLVGTVEFFPEEGKYHLDGHRDCGVVLSPEETREHDGRCPVCGRPLTIGVLNRVIQLADRHDGSRPESARDYYSLIPLKEILGEIMQVGSASKGVRAAYERLVPRLGGELQLLMERDLDEIRQVGGEVLSLAIARMRAGQVHKAPGYDGMYGRIRMFKDNEQDLLFSCAAPRRGRTRRKKAPSPAPEVRGPDPAVEGFNAQQLAAIACEEGAFVVRAGPGTGKTRVLVERMRRLISGGAAAVLALTFTTKAASEIRQRLGDERCEVATFHGLASRLLREAGCEAAVADDDELVRFAASRGLSEARAFTRELVLRLSTCRDLDEKQAGLLRGLEDEGRVPYEGLILKVMELPKLRAWEHILVDEFQDINPLQYRFLKQLALGARSLMVIGDACQSIYAFRGASPRAFSDFIQDYPACRSIDLVRTYRLHATITRASNAFAGQERIVSARAGQPIHQVCTSAPPEYIAREIDALCGGLSHDTLSRATHAYALSDIGVIVRTRHQVTPLIEALSRASIPHETAYAGSLAACRGVRQRLALLEQGEVTEMIRGIGEKTLGELQAGERPSDGAAALIELAHALVAAQQGPLIERLHGLESSGLFKLPALRPEHCFYRYAALFDTDVEGFVQFCRLTHDAQGLEGDRVRVLTAHAAKGLEFACVFITGLVEGVFPLAGMDGEEERNLFYVAMTRAIDRLYLVHAPENVSPFVSAIPSDLCERRELRVERASGQLRLFN